MHALQQESLIFHRVQNFLRFSPQLHQESLVFHRSFPLLMQNFLCFPHVWPYCTKNLGFFTGFPSSDATFPTCAYKHTTMLPAEPVKVYRDSDPKQLFSVKLFFTYSKIRPPEFIFVRLFFVHIQTLRPKTKIYVCNCFGRNGTLPPLPRPCFSSCLAAVPPLAPTPPSRPPFFLFSSASPAPLPRLPRAAQAPGPPIGTH